MAKARLRLFKLWIKEDNVTLPWLSTGNIPDDGEDRLIEVTRDETNTLFPFGADEECIQQELQTLLQENAEDLREQSVAAERIIQRRRPSIMIEEQKMQPIPITPHTNKTRKVRSRLKKASNSRESLSSIRSTRSTRSVVQAASAIDKDDDLNRELERKSPKRASTRKKPVVTKLKREITDSVIEEENNDASGSGIGREARKRTSSPRERNMRSTRSVIQSASATDEDNILAQEQEKKRPKRASTRKKPAVSKPKRTTRSSKAASSVLVMPMVQEVPDGELAADVSPHREPVKKKEKTVKIIMPVNDCRDTQQNDEPQENAIVPEENTSVIERDSLCTPEPMEGVKTPASSPKENDHSPVEVQQLVSLHETLIEQQRMDVAAQSYASPALNNAGGLKPAAKSMEDQILSCQRKNPIVNVARLNQLGIPSSMAVDSPLEPITLTLDASDDEEDIADSFREEENTVSPIAGNDREALPETPVRTATVSVCPPRRSLNIQLSLAESELDNPTKGTAPATQDETDAGGMPPMENEGEEAESSTNVTTTDSQESSLVSLCSSTAATVVLESDGNEESQDAQTEAMQASDASPLLLRRSTRQSKRSVLSGLAAKRFSQSEKLAIKRQEANSKTYSQSISSLNTKAEISAESVDSGAEEPNEGIKRKPRIAKPVLKPPRTKKHLKNPASARTNRTSIKRNIDAVESSGPFSPAPKSKQMRCASPLCHSKSRTKPSAIKRSRNNFLNRSTAASRSRRTPGCPSPATALNSRAALLAGSPYKFSSQASICLSPTPRPANLTAEVMSFIRRNTPQKVNYEEQLAARKEQLEQKRRREEEAKRRKEEEKQRKLIEKKRKQEERERKAAEQRERREREQKEKQLKQVEQWEKRIADADKVKVTRKKEETVKAKKLLKKQAEAEEIRRKEEEERLKKLKEQEQDREQRLLEQRLLKEQEAAARKQAEQEKLLEKQRQDKLREEKEAEEARKKSEEERLQREEEEKAKRKKAEDVAKLKQQKMDKEEAERKRKLQEEVQKRNAEAARIEEERLEKEKEMQRRIREEAQRRQEEAIRRKEREEARKRKVEEARAVNEEKARKRKEEELARAEEQRKRREEIRRQAEQRREEERNQRDEEKKKEEEEKRRKWKEAKEEKLKKIEESNEKLRKLEEEHKKEREKLRVTMDKSPYFTPEPNKTFNMGANTTQGSPSTYDMTPQVEKSAPSTEDNYNIDDLSSGDGTDDEDNPRKTVPKWAKGGNLRSQLINQYYNPPLMEVVFRDAMDTNGIRLEHIFPSVKARYFKRTSSAHWKSPIMPVGHISFTEQCRGFDHSSN